MTTIEQARRQALYADHVGGPITRNLGPSAQRAGYFGADWSVEQVAELIPEGGAFVAWISFGHVNGHEHFGRKVIMNAGDRLDVLRPDGNTLVSYPLGEGRTLRLFVK